MDEIDTNPTLNRIKSNLNKLSAYVKNSFVDEDNIESEDYCEISHVAYELQLRAKATSGDDELKITKVAGGFVIHFSDSAILNRTVQRGYLEINGQRLNLSDEVKKRLLSVDENVQKLNKQTFMSAMIKHELTVTKQQTDAFKKASDKQSRTMQTASRIMQGKKVSQADERELMLTNPELYAMVKSVALLKKHKDHNVEDKRLSEQNEITQIMENPSQDYSINLPEYEYLETQMTISLIESGFEVYSITSNSIE